jgi:crotonobetainyl-CoA:carnitine CoA-transferase CaiB-like acyl-CoA transferase
MIASRAPAPSHWRDGPLAGVRVLELSRVLAGPYAARLLSDLGADVIKIEPPEGDDSRQVAPKRDRGMSGLYTFANVGKRNLCVDLRAPEGAALVLELVRESDAVIENYRPGVAERLGIGWSAVHAANPRAVMISVNGFGSDSSWRDRRAYAPVLHAATGILHDQAMRTGTPVAQLAQAYGDTVTALHAAVALLSALRVAAHTGEGQRVELAMFDAILATYTETAFALLDPPGARDTGPLFCAGRHGTVALAGAPAHVWARLREAHGLADPAPGDVDVPTKAALRREAIERWMESLPDVEAIVAACEDAGLSCAAVAPLRDVLLGPLARERELLVQVDDRRGGARPVVRTPYRFSGSATGVRGPAPRRGEHNGEVLRDVLGWSDEAIRALEDKGVLQSAPPEER